MSPWKVLGWLLVALLCLLLTAGAYGLAFLWGWPLPSVWWLAAIAGAGASVALILSCSAQCAAVRMNPAAPRPLPVSLDRLPGWLARRRGLFPHLPDISKARAARFSDGAAETRICRIMEAAHPLDRRCAAPPCPANMAVTVKATRRQGLPFWAGINSRRQGRAPLAVPACGSRPVHRRGELSGHGTIPPPSCASGC